MQLCRPANYINFNEFRIFSVNVRQYFACTSCARIFGPKNLIRRANKTTYDAHTQRRPSDTMSASKRQTCQQARDTMSASKRQTCQQSRDTMSASKRHTCQQPTVRQCLAVCPAICRRNPANYTISYHSCVAPQDHSMNNTQPLRMTML